MTLSSNKLIAIWVLAILASTGCVAEQGSEPQTEASALDHHAGVGMEAAPIASGEVKQLPQTDPVGNTWVPCGRAQPELYECGEPGIPVVNYLSAGWHEGDTAAVEVVIRGLSCGADINTFYFAVFDEERVDVSGRSWPEVDEVHADGEGRFELRGLAASCGDMSRGVHIEVRVPGEEGISNTAGIALH